MLLPPSNDALRGYSADLAVLDEAAYMQDEVEIALRPMLAASQGRLVMLSTPWGRRGFFYDAWTRGEEWERHCVPAYDVPKITLPWLLRERKAMPDHAFRQEFMVEFVDGHGGGLVSEEAMRNAFGY